MGCVFPLLERVTFLSRSGRKWIIIGLMYLYLYLYIYIYVCMCVCMYLCIYIYIYILCICICICMYVFIKVGSGSRSGRNRSLQVRTVPNRIGLDHNECQGLLRTVPNRFGTHPFFSAIRRTEFGSLQGWGGKELGVNC